MHILEIPEVLKKSKCEIQQVTKKPRKKKFNSTKLVKKHRKDLPNAWKQADYTLININSSWNCDYCGYRSIFYKPIIKGKNKNKIAFRLTWLSKTYYADSRTFQKALEKEKIRDK